MSGIVVALFLYGYSAIALPSWTHSALMPLLWLALFVTGCAWFLRHPYSVLVLAVVANVAWFVLMLGGA